MKEEKYKVFLKNLENINILLENLVWKKLK